MREIYNEGRVVGLSNYELYVRQLLSLNPEATPMSEREWISCMLAGNASMILRVPQGTTAGYHDYMLPVGSQLCAATIIYGSVFQGEITLDDTGYWATRVVDYGQLISNTYTRGPITPGLPNDVPTKENPQAMTQRLRNRCKEYIKVVSGLVLQPGEWIENTYYTPLLQEQGLELTTQDGEEVLAHVNDVGIDRSLDPNFHHQPFVRLMIAEDIEEDIYIFLHGFMNSVALLGESGVLTQLGSDRPQDGDFLGPNVFPWGCPIVFTSTTDVQYAILQELQNRS